MRYFALDLTTAYTVELTDISVRSINDIYLRLRHRMAEECAMVSPFTWFAQNPSAAMAADCVKTSQRINFEYFRGALDPSQDGDRRTWSVLEGRFFALRNSDVFLHSLADNRTHAPLGLNDRNGLRIQPEFLPFN